MKEIICNDILIISFAPRKQAYARNYRHMLVVWQAKVFAFFGNAVLKLTCRPERPPQNLPMPVFSRTRGELRRSSFQKRPGSCVAPGPTRAATPQVWPVR